MARPSRMSVLKRKREREKAEKAALKREMRQQRDEQPERLSERVASRDDLAGYGLIDSADEEPEV